jgi:Predicted membrane protein (DUF2306)
MIKTLINTFLFEEKSESPQKTLLLAGKFWFISTTVGQYAFGLYIVLLYAVSAAANNLEKWNKQLFSGFIVGDWLGNFLLLTHILLASVIIFGGPLQFMPFVRNKHLKFHRWLGRCYLAISVFVSFAGVIMLIKGKSIGNLFMHASNSAQFIYISCFAFMAIKTAMSRKFQEHQKWVLRLFIVNSGVWFFRIWFTVWDMFNQGQPVGFDSQTFTGPFLEILAFITYLVPLPLILAELYFYSVKKKNPPLQIFTAAIITVFTLVMIIGIYGTITKMWLPKILNAFQG